MILMKMMMQKMILMKMMIAQKKVTDESGEESEDEKLYYFDMDVDDSEDNEVYVLKKERKKQQKQKLQNVEKLRIKSPELSQTLPVDSSEVISKARPMKDLICCVCLGDISETDDEIVECDNCSVAVHEGCYGISDNQSAASTESSVRTEPCFCDAYKAGVRPTCELCPNKGGIFKETDAVKWVHLVCALYTHGVALVMNLMEDGLISHWLTWKVWTKSV